MAQCENHGTVGHEKTQSLYVTVKLDNVRYHRRLKLCSGCLNDLAGIYGPQWSDGYVIVRFNPESACVSCGEVRGDHGTLWPLYATGFGPKDRRFDYHATYCDACAKSVISNLRLDVSNGHDA